MRILDGRAARGALVCVDAFAAVTAIGGGFALAAGLERERFPVRWLDRTPFRSYVGPGAILASVVGGSAAAATIAAAVSGARGARISIAAGLILAGWISAEVALLADDGPQVSRTEAVYLAIAAAMSGLGAAVERAGRRPDPSAGGH